MAWGCDVDEEEDTDDSGIGIHGLVWLRGDKGQPGMADDGVAAAVAGVAAHDGVAPALARPRCRGPGRSHTLPACAAGVIGPPCRFPGIPDWRRQTVMHRNHQYSDLRETLCYLHKKQH